MHGLMDDVTCSLVILLAVDRDNLSCPTFFFFTGPGLWLYFIDFLIIALVMQEAFLNLSQCCASQVTVKEVIDCQISINDCQNLTMTLTVFPYRVDIQVIT